MKWKKNENVDRNGRNISTEVVEPAFLNKFWLTKDTADEMRENRESVQYCQIPILCREEKEKTNFPEIKFYITVPNRVL
jgi:hypothetical protein